MTEPNAALAAPEKEPGFWMWADRLGLVRDALVKVEKKAAKLGLPAPVLTVVETKWIAVKTRGTELPTGQLRESIRVTVEGEPPRIAGWTFLATLQHLEGDVIVRVVPGAACPPEFRKADPRNCDHCRTVRNRLDTFVLRGDDGTFKQVGRNCLADFLNTTSPEAIASLAAALADFAGVCDAEEEGMSDGGWGGRGSWGFSTGEFLTVAARMVREYGFRKSRCETGKSTVSYVWDVLMPPTGNFEGAEKLRAELRGYRDTINDDDREKAIAALEWVLGLPESATDSDYIHNLRVAASQPVVRERTGGILASLIAVFDRERPVEVVDVNRKPSEYVGELKKRATFKLTLLDFRSFERDGFGRYGSETCFIYNFADEAGNLLTWFSSGNAGLVKGERYTIKGTPKKHEEFRGAKTTYLSRCVVVEPKEAP